MKLPHLVIKAFQKFQTLNTLRRREHSKFGSQKPFDLSLLAQTFSLKRPAALQTTKLTSAKLKQSSRLHPLKLCALSDRVIIVLCLYRPPFGSILENLFLKVAS